MTTLNSSPALLKLGNASGSLYTFSGYLDDVRIYNKVLTPAQVLQLYNNNASSTTLTPYLTPRSVLYTTPSLPANAWTKVAFTLPGDTVSGLWTTDAGSTGLTLSLCLGASTSSPFGLSNVAAASNNAASVWNNAIGYADTTNQLFGASSNNFLANLGNSLLVTGVQLEKGSLATALDVRPPAIEALISAPYLAAANGYTTVPGSGIMYQWGSFNNNGASFTNNTQYTASFPVAFNSSVLQVFTYPSNTVTTNTCTVTCPVSAKTTSGFSFVFNTNPSTSTTATVRFFAIGM
jgi:hypothetical protein